MSQYKRKRMRSTDKIEENIDDFDDYNSDEYDTEGKLEINDTYAVDIDQGKNYTSLKLLKDHNLRPIWVAPDGCIYFETFNKNRKIVQEFLITIADPVSRPQHIHTYKLTDTSLYAAVSSGLKSDKILCYLEKLCKTELPVNIVKFIKKSTANYGKVSLILRHGKLKIESSDLVHLKNLIKIPEINECLLKDENGQVCVPKVHYEGTITLSNPFANINTDKKEVNLENDIVEFYKFIDEVVEKSELSNKQNPEFLKKNSLHTVEIKPTKLEEVKKRCIDQGSALLCEYDFKNDQKNPDIKMDLKPTTCLRPYQEKSLRKMFGNSRARSGIIVLPCGAGKTLVGVTAACTIRKKCIAFCTGGVAVEQWKNTFLNYTTIDEKKICRFTGSTKDSCKDTDVFITTYNIIGYSGKRSYETEETMNWIKTQEWGLILLDEVHTIPAKTFRSVLEVIHGHCMLGLTATLVREDDKINDLNFLVGPKLYEADWMELQDKGFIARVQCVEVRCPMTPEFYAAYLRADSQRQMLLYLMNPEKIRRCEFLIKEHEKRKDKIIVFSDNLFALRMYAKKMNRLYLEGDTGHSERMQVMNMFRTTKEVNTIFVSKMADVALDLPEATVLIQISSQGGSRRQEAQRLGRITRAKKGMRPDEINGYFYSLISTDTTEQTFSSKRQQFLRDVGYSYKVITELPMNANEGLYSSNKEQMDLLQTVIDAHENQHEIEGKKMKKDLLKKKVVGNTAESLSKTMAKKRKIMEQETNRR